MDNFDTVLNATKDDYENYILSNPLLEVLASGRMTRIHYIGYLRETYHLVRHTSKALALVGSHRRNP